MASVDEARRELRAELEAWIVERLGLFTDLLDADAPLTIPVVSDFRLMLCVEDAGDGESSTFYPTVGSDTALHRHVGLTRYMLAYLLDRDD